MSPPHACSEVQSVLVELGPQALITWPDHLLLHLDHCPTCRALVAALRTAPGQLAVLYDESLRHRTLAAVRTSAKRRKSGPGWLLLPPAAACALIGTFAPPWLLAIVLQSMSFTPALAWTLAAAAMLVTSGAAVSIVAMFVDRPLAAWSGAAGRLRLLEV